MAGVHFKDLTASAVFDGTDDNQVTPARFDGFGRACFHGFAFYTSATARCSVYHGTSSSAPKICTISVDATIQPSDVVMFTVPVNCQNGLYVKNEAGTFTQLTIFYEP